MSNESVFFGPMTREEYEDFEYSRVYNNVFSDDYYAILAKILYDKGYSRGSSEYTVYYCHRRDISPRVSFYNFKSFLMYLGYAVSCGCEKEEVCDMCMIDDSFAMMHGE